MPTFQEKLNEQIAYEFAASQQYIAIAVHYDAETLPQLAAHFYRQAVEERNHAMMMVQYLLDADDDVPIPAVAAPQTVLRRRRRARRARARPGEARHRADLAARRASAREEGDLVGEQFMHWFLQEQREEVSSMSALLRSSSGSKDNVMLVEDYLARESRRRRTRSRRARRRRPAARSRARVVELERAEPSGRASSSTSRATCRRRGRGHDAARRCSSTCRTRRRA